MPPLQNFAPHGVARDLALHLVDLEALAVLLLLLEERGVLRHKGTHHDYFGYQYTLVYNSTGEPATIDTCANVSLVHAWPEAETSRSGGPRRASRLRRH